MKSKRFENRNAEITRSLKEGIPAKDIAQKFHINQARVKEIGSQNGVVLHSHRMAKKRNKFIIELLERGISRENICKHFNLGPDTVKVIAHKAGVLTPWQKMLEQRNLAIIAQLKKGTTPVKTAARFNVQKYVIWYVAKKHGFKLSSARKKDDVKRMLKEGYRAADIAKKLGMLHQSVSYHIRKMSL